MVARAALARLPCAVGAAVKRADLFDAVADDFAAAMIADGREFMNRTLETIEDVPLARRHYFKRQIIIVAAYFTLRHFGLLLFLHIKVVLPEFVKAIVH